MSDFILSCCSTADLSLEHMQQRDISYICFHYRLNGVDYPDDLGQTMSFKDFYAAMAGGADTSTSQVNVGEYTAYFIRLLESGKDVLHVSLSSGLSGTFRSAQLAAATVAPAFPNQKLYVVDSLGASSGYGLIMDTLADKRDEGMGIDEMRDWLLAHRLEMNHWFFSTDLTFYVKGGRVSRAEAWLGGILDICPVLNMNNEGKLIPRSKVRGKKKAVSALEELMEQCARGGVDYNGKCYISNSAILDCAQTLAGKIEARFPKLNGKVEINDIGTTIGSHTGPGTVALFFWGKPRED